MTITATDRQRVSLNMGAVETLFGIMAENAYNPAESPLTSVALRRRIVQTTAHEDTEDGANLNTTDLRTLLGSLFAITDTLNDSASPRSTGVAPGYGTGYGYAYGDDATFLASVVDRQRLKLNGGGLQRILEAIGGFAAKANDFPDLRWAVIHQLRQIAGNSGVLNECSAEDLIASVHNCVATVSW